MKTYCLSGFGETLDCRPIVLLEPPPKELACVFCNVVSATPTPLPCGHQACRVCRREVLLRGNVCPFDKVSFAKDLVEPEGGGGARGFAAVSRIEARCFNFPFGCPFTGTLREMELHFPDGCNHHKVTCLNCSKDVLQRLLAEHIFSGCVEHVPMAPPASSADDWGSEASQRRLSALEKTIEERFRALLLSSANRKESELSTLTEEDTSSVAVSNSSTTLRPEFASSSSEIPTPPSKELPQDKEEIVVPQNTSSGRREVLSGRGALHVAQYWRKAEADSAQSGRDSNDGTLSLGEHYLKLTYTYSKKENGDVVIFFQILLREDDNQERAKSGRRGIYVLDRSLPKSPEQEAKAAPLFDGTIALSLCRPGSSEEHPLPTYLLPEGAPEGDCWSVVACTTEVDWEEVEQYLDDDTLQFCLRLE